MRMIIVVSLSLLLLGVGCSDKEGALLKVTSELDKPIVSLRFIIGEDTVAGSDHFSDTRGLEIVGVQDRDLSSDPYLLFLNSKNFGEESQRLYSQDIVVGVVALNEAGNPIGYGVFDTIHFGAGQIREWTVPIKKLDDGFIESEHCVQWVADGTPVYIGLTGDEDCDGDLAGAFPDDPDADCDDRDPDRYHGRTEICDNGLDDNCNGMPDELEDDDDDGFLLCDESESQRDCDDNDRETFPRSAKVCGEDTLICSSMESPPSREGLKCFTEGIGDGCVGGLWSCDGSDNGELVCDTMDGAYPVRPGFCTVDPNCVQGNFDECIPTEMVSCSFSYTTNMPIQVCGSDGALGAGSFSFPIPTGPPGCDQSKVQNEMIFPGWNLRVKDGPGDCIGDVVEATRIMAPPDPQSGPVLVLIEQSDENDVLYHFRILIDGNPVGECEPTDGFSCMSNGSEWNVDLAPPMPNE